MTDEELLLLYGKRIAFAAAAEADARPKPIIVAVNADEPRQPERSPEYVGRTRVLH
jgi:hypothetical protein